MNVDANAIPRTTEDTPLVCKLPVKKHLQSSQDDGYDYTLPPPTNKRVAWGL